jgi:F-type H+-transporting ATPase subunit delta
MTNQMLTAKIAEPYAKALFKLAESTSTIDFITTDINSLLEIFNANKALSDYLTNPLYSKSSKKAVLEKVISSQFLNQNTKQFLMVLIDRSRIGMFPAIGEKYLQQIYKLAKIRIAQISSAEALTDEQENELIKQIQKITSAKQVKLVKSVDSSLLGGLQVNLGSTVIDTSLKGQLRELATQLEIELF